MAIVFSFTIIIRTYIYSQSRSICVNGAIQAPLGGAWVCLQSEDLTAVSQKKVMDSECNELSQSDLLDISVLHRESVPWCPSSPTKKILIQQSTIQVKPGSHHEGLNLTINSISVSFSLLWWCFTIVLITFPEGKSQCSLIPSLCTNWVMPLRDVMCQSVIHSLGSEWCGLSFRNPDQQFIPFQFWY